MGKIIYNLILKAQMAYSLISNACLPWFFRTIPFFSVTLNSKKLQDGSLRIVIFLSENYGDHLIYSKDYKTEFSHS